MATSSRTSDDVAGTAEARVRELSDAVRAAAGEAESQLEQLSTTAEAGFRQANAALRQRSDESLAIVGAFSVGLAVGLLLGGANRLLIAVALVPAALIAGVGLERVDRETGRGARKPER